VRFTSKKSIRESLTGRIINVTLLPMVLTELLQIAESKTIQNFLKNGVGKFETYFADKNLQGAIVRRGTSF
jgi:predicted AAA+ superfamily ATPase